MIETCKEMLIDLSRQLGLRLSSGTLNSVADCMVKIKMPYRKILLQEGEVCKAIFYLQKGLIRQYSKKGPKEVTENMTLGGVFVCCLESYLKKKPSKTVIQTLEPCVIYAFPQKEMKALMAQSTEVCQLYMAIIERMLLDAQHRADILRIGTAKKRFEAFHKEESELVRRSPQNYMASFLQIRPETLSRIRSNM